MQIAKFIGDASGVSEQESSRQKFIALSTMLEEDGNAASPEMVKKWAERQSIPAGWMVKILKAAGKRERHLNVTDYI